MTLKNKKRMYVLAAAVGTILTVTSFAFALFGGAHAKEMKDVVYHEVEQTEAYQKYYDMMESEYYQAYSEGKISFSDYKIYEEKISAEGYVKYMSKEERKELNEKLKPAKDFEKKCGYSGGGIGLAGLTMLLVAGEQYDNVKEEEEKEKEKEMA